MGAVISKLVFVKVDQQGNPYTEGWYTLEFQAAGYRPGGEFFDFSPDYKQVLYAQVTPLSGAVSYDVRANGADFPSAMPPVSARIQLQGIASGLTVVVASGTQLLQSGGLISGNLSNAFSIQFVGLVGSGGAFMSEPLSGVAVSGVRAMAHLIGY